MPSLLINNVNGARTGTKLTTLSKKSQLLLLSEKAKEASKAAAVEKEREVEEETKRKQAEADKREQRALDRQKKQEEKKKTREENKAKKSNQVSSKDGGDNTNVFLSEINNPGDDIDMDMDDGDNFNSPSNNGATKLFEKGENEEMVTTDNDDITSPDYKRGKSSGNGVLKVNHRYSSRNEEGARAMAKPNSPMYVHTKFVDIGMLLESDDKAMECITLLKTLLINCQYIAKVSFVELTSKEEGSPAVLHKPSDIPTNFTLLGKFFKMTTEDPFKKKQQWNKKDEGNKHREEEEERIYSKAVYGTIRLTAIVPIEELVAAVHTEWQAKGGLKIAIKGIQAPESKFVATIFFQSIHLSPETVQATFAKFLSNVQEVEAERDSNTWDEHVTKQIQVVARLQVPKTFHIANKNEKVAWKIKQHRQAWCIEVPASDFVETKRLMAEGKAMEGMVEALYSKHTIISEVMTREDSAADNTRFSEVMLKHGKYNFNMKCIALSGFGNMSQGALLAGDGAETITALEFLPSVLKLEGGYPAIAEIYQLYPGGTVEVIYLKCAESDHMMAQLGKNPAAYIVHALKALIGEDSARRMAAACCIPEHVSEIDDCTWDEKTKTLVTASEANQSKELNCFDSPFWNQAFDIEEMLALQRKEKGRINPETLFNLESTGTIKSIHNRTKTKSITFEGDGDDDDEGSAASSIDSYNQLATDNHNTEAMGKTPSHASASVNIVSPKESVDGSVPAVSG